jgi:hypothetical protein
MRHIIQIDDVQDLGINLILIDTGRSVNLVATDGNDRIMACFCTKLGGNPFHHLNRQRHSSDASVKPWLSERRPDSTDHRTFVASEKAGEHRIEFELLSSGIDL